MLVLSRRPGESIVVGDGIRITILKSSGSRVRIGIEAPADVRIVRQSATDTEPESTPPVRRPLSPRLVRHDAAAAHPPAPFLRPVIAFDRHTALE